MTIKSSLFAVLVLLSTTAAAFATPAIVTDNANVRVGPSTQYRIIATAPAGLSVDITYCTEDDDWCLVDEHGWIRATYLQADWSQGVFAEDHDDYYQAPAALYRSPGINLHRAMPLFGRNGCVGNGMTQVCL